MAEGAAIVAGAGSGIGRAAALAAGAAFLASDAASLFVGQTLGPNSGDVML